MANVSKKQKPIKEKVKTAVAGTVAAVGIATSLITTVPTTPPKTPKVDKPTVSDTVEVEAPKQEEVKKSDNKKTDKNKDANKNNNQTSSKTNTDNIPNNNTNSSTDAPSRDLTNFTTEIPYILEKESDYATSILINASDTLSIDIVEMYFKGDLVDYCLLPNNNKITSIPLIFDNLYNLEFKLYRAGEVVGTAVIDGKMLTDVKEVQ